MSLASQLIYTISRQLILLPFLLLLDQNIFVGMTIFLLSSDIAINLAGASQADTYVRLTKGSVNEFDLLKDRYACALLLQVPVLFFAAYFVNSYLTFFAVCFYTITNVHTLFSQKIALNQGKLYAVSVDYLLKSAAMLLAYAYLSTSYTDLDLSHIVLLSVCLGQALSMFINMKLWGSPLQVIAGIRFSKNVGRYIFSRESLFIPYVLMAILMRGEPLIVGLFFDQSPDAYVYFSFIALASYLPSLLASGSVTNLIAQISKAEVHFLSLAALVLAFLFSWAIGWYWAGDVSGFIYPKNVISGTIPLVMTVFLSITTNLLKPKLTLRGNLFFLSTNFLWASIFYVMILLVFDVSYEAAFLCGAALRFLSVSMSVWGFRNVR